MAKRQVPAPAARQDLRQILIWSERKFGHAAAARDRALLKQAVREIKPILLAKALKNPRHFLLCRHRPDGSLEIARIFEASAISTLNSLATTAVHDNRRFYNLMARRTICLLAFTLALQSAPPDFSKDVAPILEKHCLQCHRPGGIAVPLTSYETVRP